MRRMSLLFGLLALLLAACSAQAEIATPRETPYFEYDVGDGKLPPVALRLPLHPRIIDLPSMNRETGHPGGTWKMLMGDQRDLRMMTIYSYARLVVFDDKLNFVPDILESIQIEDDKVFTLHLREGHKWSDGQPFTTEDFRYYWEDVANNATLSPSGPSPSLLVRGKPPRVEIIDATTVRYSWDEPNPAFLPALAGSQPLFIFMPAHYLKQFNAKYADTAALDKLVKKARVMNWGSLHERMSRQYRCDNPDLPTLDPWRNRTSAPAELFVFERNPYFHRVDQTGQQLPYLDRVTLSLGTTSLIPAKTASGDSTLQARYLGFEDYTFLKQNEDLNHYKVNLWENGQGSFAALMPNLNAKDPVWQRLLRDVRFRRALSLGINRHDINQALFFGLARESADTVLPQSPLFKETYAKAWSTYDPAAANKLLDEAGLDKRGSDGFRLLPDGRRADLIVETAGDVAEYVDILELVGDDWAKIGLRAFTHPAHRDVFRKRILDGDTIMSIGSGIDNGNPTSAIEPDDLAPMHESQFQWPRWGLYQESDGHEGDAVDVPEAAQLVDLYRAWRRSTNKAQRQDIWGKMLSINSDQVFSIGIINGTKQPVVISDQMRNVPVDALYAFDPSGFFGIYMPDTFWLANAPGG
ncbi:ABC transporter substrate-binding protein [Lichenihabitans psoromatis]|uniref:ABC transporter substrate-binding protein n=1 Tax=Lichenihabitans psoromatis TaxID=2528642 RepID=UPI001FDF13C1|nr:ABC transporter substrate-binding protein [Lichenihabitans psoromatis]